MRRAIAVLTALIATTSAFGQYGAGVYVPRGPAVGVWTGAAFGYVPGAYRGFWSNGYSLYGPPVPTYGSVPGYFGGSDQRLANFPDLRHSWYGPWGWRGGYVALDNAGARPQAMMRLACCEVRLPADDAEVYVNGSALNSSGAVRRFHADVPPGTAVTYEIEARWATARSIGSARRSVVLRSGETAVADFTAFGG
jgi:uncharacterized protein (TIGR03000 family)